MITKLAQLEAGMLTQAALNASTHGLSYVDMNAFFRQQSDDGEISAEVLSPELIAAGVTPIRAMLMQAGVTLTGLNASSCDVFFSSDKNFVRGAEVLLPLFAQEIWETSLGLHASQDLSFQSRPGTPGDTVYPVEVRGQVDQRQDVPSQTVSTDDLVSVTFGIDGDSYKTARVTNLNTADTRYEMGRTTEASDLPLYSITTAERAVNIFKFGGRVRWTYEAMRRMKINQLEILLQVMAFAEDMRRRKAALAVAVNGDGNGNGAIVTQTPDNLYSIRNLDEFGMDVAYNSSLDLTMYAADLGSVKNIRALRYGPGGSVLNPDQLAMYGDAYTMPNGAPLKLAPKGSILTGVPYVLGWNPTRALEQVVENGSQISEQARFITNQTEELTMSVNMGYGKPYDNSFQALITT